MSLSDLTFDGLDFTGTPNSHDRDASTLVLTTENNRRAAAEPPEALLPVDTGAEQKTSYLFMLVQRVAEINDYYIDQASIVEAEDVDVKELWRIATDDQRDAAVIALQA